jgi:hypothetical protein
MALWKLYWRSLWVHRGAKSVQAEWKAADAAYKAAKRAIAEGALTCGLPLGLHRLGAAIGPQRPPIQLPQAREQTFSHIGSCDRKLAPKGRGGGLAATFSLVQIVQCRSNS